MSETGAVQEAGMRRLQACGYGVGPIVLLFCAAIACAGDDKPSRHDPHSYGNPEQVRVNRILLFLIADFERRELSGTAGLKISRQPGCPPDAPLILDTRDLTIESIQLETGNGPHDKKFDVPYELGSADPIRGTPLTIHVPPELNELARVDITYHTSPSAKALQWVEPSGTAGKKYPFLYSQSQAIQARSWIPCQDSPGVRVTYDASIQVKGDQQTLPIMSAQGPIRRRWTAFDGTSHDSFGFMMDQPIPPYLIALAVGNLKPKPLGERTGVWAEPELIEKAASEFVDTEAMLAAAEKRFGPYRWGRYNILVLPPSFPFGGMENAMMTFVTPSVLAGDRSLVSLIAHEMAHSWSGNLVTCATWRDFWLNEGTTTYLERRITEDVFGPERAAMEWQLGRESLDAQLAQFDKKDQVLAIDLVGRDPDEGLTGIPYEKGSLFLKRLEVAFGRDRFDPFLKGYFDHFAFQSITTEDFVAYAKAELFPANPDAARAIDLDAWLHQPGLPPDAPVIKSEKLQVVEAASKRWLDEQIAAKELPGKDWSTPEWVHFLRSLPPVLPAERLAELDAAFHLTDTANAEVTEPWLILAIRAGYAPADARLESFLTTIGRRKYLQPIYTELARTPDGKARARAIYDKARPGYHPLAIESLDRFLDRH